MHLEKVGKGLLVTLLRALDKAALRIVPTRLLLGRNYFRCCRGNYASGHGTLSFDRLGIYPLFRITETFSLPDEIRETGTNLLSGSLCSCVQTLLYWGCFYAQEAEAAIVSAEVLRAELASAPGRNVIRLGK
jgi:hypothetical protein